VGRKCVRHRIRGTFPVDGHSWVITELGGGAFATREVAMKVRNCMTNDVQIANPDQTIREVAQVMARLDAGSVPVGDNDRLVGMITDRDIAIRGIATGKGPDAKVRDVMSRDVKYCFDDEEIDEVLHNMGDLQVRRLPVLNRGKRLVGIISLGDLATSGKQVTRARH
jgi:CBS domain-containing protein